MYFYTMDNKQYTLTLLYATSWRTGEIGKNLTNHSKNDLV